ncbi:protein yippee-like [Citrus sinensis]|uniref:Protein yippee-like n=1 Tax=Citrus sinensis TaxID=2711 RepID=A0ACB8L0T7_CITSI|nr:protein yippee-like [Citrus sinensis]
MGRLFVVNLEGKIYSCKHCRTHLALCEDVVSKEDNSKQERINNQIGEIELKQHGCFSIVVKLDASVVVNSEFSTWFICGIMILTIVELWSNSDFRHGKAYLFSKVCQCDKITHVVQTKAKRILVVLLRRVNCMYSLDMRKMQLVYLLQILGHCLKTVNVSVGEKEERLMMTGMHTVADIFCVGCGSIVGWKYETAHEKSQKYKEGKSVLERFKVSGPDGSNYWVSHEAHVGGSDADDA